MDVNEGNPEINFQCREQNLELRPTRQVESLRYLQQTRAWYDLPGNSSVRHHAAFGSLSTVAGVVKKKQSARVISLSRFAKNFTVGVSLQIYFLEVSNRFWPLFIQDIYNFKQKPVL